MTDRPDCGSALRALLGPDAPEITCEECFERLDEYVDRELAQAPADEAVPGMRAHLEGCTACREEHASLLALARSEMMF
jgi:anti-sigma factor RsiW